MRCTVSYCLLTHFNEFVVVFFLSANPVKDTVMFRTSVELSHNNIRKFSSVGYVTHVCLGVHVQVHMSRYTILALFFWSFIGDSSWCTIWWFYFTLWKKTKTFFSVNTPGYFPTYLHLCIIHLPFVQPFYILFRFSLYVPCKLRFLIYV